MDIKSKIQNEIEDPILKRRFVRELFGRVAGRYDLTNDVMSLGLHRRWKSQMLRLAELDSDHYVLDLAAGTGDLAIRAGRHAAVTVAADLTLPMIETGRSRAGSERVGWLVGDALELPFRGESFDRVLIGYGLRNFSELTASLAEIRRCLKPGGRLLALDFGRPHSGRIRSGYFRYLELMTRVVGWALHRDVEAYLYIPQSLRQFPGQEGVLARMGELGFVSCGYVELLFGTMAINFGRRPRVTARVPRSSSTA